MKLIVRRIDIIITKINTLHIRLAVPRKYIVLIAKLNFFLSMILLKLYIRYSHVR